MPLLQKIPPIISKRNSCFIKMATNPKVAPIGIDPVSPIKICAGFELYHKKPRRLPIKAEIKTTISPTLDINGRYK